MTRASTGSSSRSSPCRSGRSTSRSSADRRRPPLPPGSRVARSVPGSGVEARPALGPRPARFGRDRQVGHNAPGMSTPSGRPRQTRTSAPASTPTTSRPLLRVLEQLPGARRRPPGHPDGQAGDRPDVQAGPQGPPPRGQAAADRPRRGDPRQDRDRLADADRRRDQGDPARRPGGRHDGGRAAQASRLLHLQGRLHARRRVLPLALPDLRRQEPRQARPAGRPHRQARPAHRWPRQDRHVHRAHAPARRRPPHDHDPVPPRRGDEVRRAGGLGASGSTGSRSSASTCATPPRSSRSPTRSPPPARSTSSSTTPRRRCGARPGSYSHLVDGEQVPLEQQRPLPRARDLRPDQRRPPGQPPRHADAPPRSPTTRASPRRTPPAPWPSAPRRR